MDAGKMSKSDAAPAVEAAAARMQQTAVDLASIQPPEGLETAHADLVQVLRDYARVSADYAAYYRGELTRSDFTAEAQSFNDDYYQRRSDWAFAVQVRARKAGVTVPHWVVVYGRRS